LAKKSKSDKKVESKPVKKGMRFIALTLVIICVILLLFLIFNQGMVVEALAAAELADISGDVDVKQGDTWTAAETSMELHESDSVRTGDNSSVSIILFKGSIIRLDSNTEVTLKEIIEDEETSVTIEQNAGRTWSTIQKVSGIDNYEVETPTAVASVRGTSFDVNVSGGITIISVIKGSVNVSATENETTYTVTLNQNYSITIDSGVIGAQVDIILDDWIANNLLEDEAFTQDLKTMIYENIEPYMEELKDRIGMTDEEIEILIDGYIRGDFPIPPETPDEYKELFELS